MKSPLPSRIALFVAIVAGAAMLAAGAAQSSCGDCNGDGMASILDALSAAQHAAGIITLVSPAFENCDVQPEYGDGTVGITDSLRHAQRAAGLVQAPFCSTSSPPVTLESVTIVGSQCVGAGQLQVPVEVLAASNRPGPLDVLSLGLRMSDPMSADVTGEYTVTIDPASPTTLLPGTSTVLRLLVDMPSSPTPGPITVDADISVTDPAGGQTYGDTGADLTATWVFAPFFYDFETSMQGWVGTQDWEWGVPGGLLPPKGGQVLWGTVVLGDYTAQGSPGNPTGRSTLDSPPIDLAGLALPRLAFTMYRDFEAPNWDGGNLKASTDGGMVYDVVLQPDSPPYDGALETIGSANPMAGEQAWLGTPTGAYESVSVDLGALAGQIVHLRFDFGADQAGSSPQLGWYVDDVIVCDQALLPPERVCCPIPADTARGVLASAAGIQLAWGAAAGATSYDIYLDTQDPPATLVAGGVAGVSAVSSPLLPQTTYYWRVDATSAGGTTPGPVWRFDTGIYTQFPEIVINEISVDPTDFVEIVNKGTVAIDITGWRLEMHGGGTLSGIFYFPQGTILDPGGYAVVTDRAIPPGFQWEAPFDIVWTTGGVGETILRTEEGMGVDYFAHNTASFPSLPPDLAFSVAAPIDVSVAGGASRRNWVDTDTDADWEPSFAITRGEINPGQPAALPPPRAYPETPLDGATEIFPSASGTEINWDVNSHWVDFDLFLDTVNPPVTSVSSGMSGTTFQTAALPRGVTFYWQVATNHAGGSTFSPVFSFTTSSSIQVPDVILNEVSTVAPQYVELYNAEAFAVDVSNWHLTTLNRAVGSIDGVYEIPAGTVMVPGELLVIQDFGDPPPGGLLTGFDIRLSPLAAGEVLLQATGFEGADYVALGTMTFTILPPDLSFTAATGLSLVGTGVAARASFVDTDDISDWQATATATPAFENPAQPIATPPHPPVNPQPDDIAIGGLALPSGQRLCWEPSVASVTSYRVWFGDAYPPSTSLGVVAQPTVVSPALLPGRTYFWRVDPTNAIGSATGDIWSFTTGSVVSNPVLLNEISFSGTDFVELINVSPSPVALGGWTLEITNDGVTDGVFVFPAGTVIPRNDVLVVAKAPLGAALVTPFPITWMDSLDGTPECVLRDAQGQSRDYVFATSDRGGDLPSRRPTTQTYHLDASPEFPLGMQTLARGTQTDSDRSSDWILHPAGTPGTLNPGQ